MLKSDKCFKLMIYVMKFLPQNSEVLGKPDVELYLVKLKKLLQVF